MIKDSLRSINKSSMNSTYDSIPSTSDLVVVSQCDMYLRRPRKITLSKVTFSKNADPSNISSKRERLKTSPKSKVMNHNRALSFRQVVGLTNNINSCGDTSCSNRTLSLENTAKRTSKSTKRGDRISSLLGTYQESLINEKFLPSGTRMLKPHHTKYHEDPYGFKAKQMPELTFICSHSITNNPRRTTQYNSGSSAASEPFMQKCRKYAKNRKFMRSKIAFDYRAAANPNARTTISFMNNEPMLLTPSSKKKIVLEIRLNNMKNTNIEEKTKCDEWIY